MLCAFCICQLASAAMPAMSTKSISIFDNDKVFVKNLSKIYIQSHNFSDKFQTSNAASADISVPKEIYSDIHGKLQDSYMPDTQHINKGICIFDSTSFYVASKEHFYSRLSAEQWHVAEKKHDKNELAEDTNKAEQNKKWLQTCKYKETATPELHLYIAYPTDSKNSYLQTATTSVGIYHPNQRNTKNTATITKHRNSLFHETSKNKIIRKLYITYQPRSIFIIEMRC